jgi:protein-tyrosine phosphatase
MSKIFCDIPEENIFENCEFIHKVVLYIIENNIKHDHENFLYIFNKYIFFYIDKLISKTHIHGFFTHVEKKLLMRKEITDTLVKLIQEGIWDGLNFDDIERYMLDIVSANQQINDHIMSLVILNRYTKHYINITPLSRQFKINDVSNFIVKITNCDGNLIRNTIEDFNILSNERVINNLQFTYTLIKTLWSNPSGTIVSGIFYGFSRPTYPENLTMYKNIYQKNLALMKIQQKLRYVHDVLGVNTYLDFEETDREHNEDIENERNIWLKLCSQTINRKEKPECKFISSPVVDFTNPAKEQIMIVLSSLINCQDTKKCPLVAGHCSAGLGRTGMFVLGILTCIYKTKSIDETLKILRMRYIESSYNEISMLHRGFMTDNDPGWSKYLDVLATQILSNPVCIDLQNRYGNKIGTQMYDLEIEKNEQSYNEFYINSFKILKDNEYCFGSITTLFSDDFEKMYNYITSRTILNRVTKDNNIIFSEDEKTEIMETLFVQRYLFYYLKYSEQNNLIKFTKKSLLMFYHHLQIFIDEKKEIERYIKDAKNIYDQKKEPNPENDSIMMRHVKDVIMHLWKEPEGMKNVDDVFIGMPEQESNKDSNFKIMRNMRYLRDIFGIEKYFNFRKKDTIENMMEKTIWERLCSQQQPIGIDTRCVYVRMPVKDFTAPSMKQIEKFLKEISNTTISAGHCREGKGRTGAFILAILKTRYDIESFEDLIELLKVKYTVESANEVLDLIDIPENKSWHKYVGYLNTINNKNNIDQI